mgnify:CR=1 FL=1
MIPLEHQWLGRVDYLPTWELQKERRAAIQGDASVPDLLLTLEHPPVLTSGRRARAENLRADPAELDGVEVLAIERGGDWTYHGPGQLVLYGVVSLRRRRLAVKTWVKVLEDAMCDVAGDVFAACGADLGDDRFGLRCDAPGAWLLRGDGTSAKVGAVGVHVGHGVTLHGLALNVDPAPWGFDWIVPCGLDGEETTSLAKLVAAGGGDPAALPSVEEIGERLADAVALAIGS